MEEDAAGHAKSNAYANMAPIGGIPNTTRNKAERKLNDDPVCKLSILLSGQSGESAREAWKFPVNSWTP